MSASNVDPADVTLVDLYTDPNQQYKDTTRYGNGKMPTVLYPSVNYRGSASEDDVKAFIQEKIVIYQIKFDGSGDGEPVPYDKLTSYDGPYLTDVNRSVDTPPFSAVASSSASNVLTDVRAPQWYILPQGIYGELHWYAKIEETGQSTIKNLVTVTSIRLGVNDSDVEIFDYKVYSENLKLRQLRYKPGSLNGNHRVASLIDTKAELSLGTSSKNLSVLLRKNTWGSAIDYRDPVIPIIGSSSERIRYTTFHHKGFHVFEDEPLVTTKTTSWTEIRDIPEDTVRDATGGGVVLILVLRRTEGTLVVQYVSLWIEFKSDWLVVEDNFGNQMRVHIDWNYEDDKNWYTEWKVTKVDVIN